MKSLKTLIFLGLTSGNFACQTVAPPKPVIIPLLASSNFGNCPSKEGATRFDVFQNEAPYISATMDWVQGTHEDWRWEIYDTLGRTLVSGKKIKDKILTEGRFAERLKPLSLDEAGYLNYGSYTLPIKWQELMCFLAFRLPADWQSSALSVDYENLPSSNNNSSKQQGLVIYLQDGDRSTQLSVDADQVCGRIETQFLIFFKRERLSFCLFPKQQEGVLNFEKSFRIEWQNQE